MITGKVQEYFEVNYDQLVKYAGAIIRDWRRTFEAEDIVNELFLHMAAGPKIDPEKIDHYCKGWIRLTVTKERSFANLKLSITGYELTPKMEQMQDEPYSELAPEDVQRVLEKMPNKYRETLELFLKHTSIHKCCFITGRQKDRMKRDLGLARDSFRKTRNQLNISI